MQGHPTEFLRLVRYQKRIAPPRAYGWLSDERCERLEHLYDVIAAYGHRSTAPDDHRRELQRRQLAARAERQQIRDDICRDLASERGWTATPRPFSLEALLGQHGGRGHYPQLDHADAFRKKGRPVALITHSYASVEQVLVWADAMGLDAEPLEWSWYSPGTNAVILTRSRP